MRKYLLFRVRRAEERRIYFLLEELHPKSEVGESNARLWRVPGMIDSESSCGQRCLYAENKADRSRIQVTCSNHTTLTDSCMSLDYHHRLIYEWKGQCDPQVYDFWPFSPKTAMAVENISTAPTQQKVHDVIKSYRPARVSPTAGRDI